MSGLSYRARRRWALVVLLVGLPLYIVAAVSIIALFDRPGILVEFVIYLALGILWALPFRMVFRGIGRPDPEAEPGAPADAPPVSPSNAPSGAAADAKRVGRRG